MSVICKSTSELKTVLETDGVPSAQEVVDVVPPSVPLAPLEEIGEEDGEKLTENERAVLELGVEGGEEDEAYVRPTSAKRSREDDDLLVAPTQLDNAVPAAADSTSLAPPSPKRARAIPVPMTPKLRQELEAGILELSDKYIMPACVALGDLGADLMRKLPDNQRTRAQVMECWNILHKLTEWVIPAATIRRLSDGELRIDVQQRWGNFAAVAQRLGVCGWIAHGLHGSSLQSVCNAVRDGLAVAASLYRRCFDVEPVMRVEWEGYQLYSTPPSMLTGTESHLSEAIKQFEFCVARYATPASNEMWQFQKTLTACGASLDLVDRHRAITTAVWDAADKWYTFKCLPPGAMSAALEELQKKAKTAVTLFADIKSDPTYAATRAADPSADIAMRKIEQLQREYATIIESLSTPAQESTPLTLPPKTTMAPLEERLLAAKERVNFAIAHLGAPALTSMSHALNDLDRFVSKPGWPALRKSLVSIVTHLGFAIRYSGGVDESSANRLYMQIDEMRKSTLLALMEAHKLQSEDYTKQIVPELSHFQTFLGLCERLEREYVAVMEKLTSDVANVEQRREEPEASANDMELD